ncbi:MFS transporter [Ornithinimicrobium flavum]|uniref:MFS transporter n=1 Tax=Ornithinimicrobium flavum TaxID=1288636 RepID=UPI003B83813E
MPMTAPVPVLKADPSRERTRAHQRAFGWYDWANSAYVTTTGTVLISPYLTALARADACPDLPSGAECTTDLSVLGVPIAVGALAPYTITVATVVSALALLFVGAIADRHPRPVRLLGGLAWTGAVAASLMFFLSGSNWQLGVLLVVVANLCLGASQVVYDALLIRVAEPDDRDRVSSRAWALGYLGGGLLLALNLGVMTTYESLGLSYEMAIRLSLLSAGLWWGVFTIIPVLGMRRIVGTTATPWTGRRAWSGAPCASWAPPSASCATTRRPCSSCWPTSSTTTASRPSSPPPASTASRPSSSRPAR